MAFRAGGCPDSHAPPKRNFIGRHGTLPNGGASPRLRRRSVLLGSAALLAASLGPVEAAKADPFAAFMAQSHLITGHDQLDEALGRRIHDSFREQDPAFDARLAVPAFRALLSDEQVARLTNTAFQQFGRGDVQVSPLRVTELRAGGRPSPLFGIARYGMVAAGVLAVAVLGLLGWWMRVGRGRAPWPSRPPATVT
jgi:hypothetical protein